MLDTTPADDDDDNDNDDDDDDDDDAIPSLERVNDSIETLKAHCGEIQHRADHRHVLIIFKIMIMMLIMISIVIFMIMLVMMLIQLSFKRDFKWQHLFQKEEMLLVTRRRPGHRK